MDDVVARSQLGERLKRTTGRCGAAARAAAEDLGVRQQGEREVPPDEATPGRADREQELGFVRKLLAGIHDASLDPAKEVLRSQGLALEREGDDSPEAAADECTQFVLGLGEPSRCDRRALGLERERLAGWEWIELDGSIEGHGLELLLRPELAHLVRLEDEIRAGRDRRHEVARDRRRRFVRLVVGEPDLDEVEPPLRGWIDRRRLDGVQRALREGREGADALDLVAEELDAQRLAPGRREDVGDPAPERELASLLNLVDPLVSGETRAARRVRRCPARRRARRGSARACVSGGGIASASAAADALTSPPAASTSSARARSPTRCGGGSSPEPQLTPRLGRSATWSSPRNQPAASATSRASASSGVRMTSGLPSSS